MKEYRFFQWIGFLTALLFSLLIFAAPLRAEEDYLWSNEAPMTKFLATYYQVDPIVVISLGQRMSYPDDVSVAIFLAKAADITPLDMLEPRLNKKSWLSITESAHLNPAIIFTPLGDKSPVTPEFSHAYSEYAKYKKDSAYRMNLYDKEFRNLVQLRLITDAFKKTPRQVMESLSAGRSFTSQITDEITPKE